MYLADSIFLLTTSQHTRHLSPEMEPDKSRGIVFLRKGPVLPPPRLPGEQLASEPLPRGKAILDWVATRPLKSEYMLSSLKFEHIRTPTILIRRNFKNINRISQNINVT